MLRVVLIGVLYLTLAFYRSEATTVRFRGNSLLRYDISKMPLNFNANRLSLRFKTLEQDGLLLALIGSNMNSVVVRLTKAKLRYQLTVGGRRLIDLLLGAQLADNRWHTLSVLRTGRLNHVTIDGRVERKVLIPGLYSGVRIDKTIFVAGLENPLVSYTLYENEGLQLLPYYRGCMEKLVIDSRRPLQFYEEGDPQVSATGLIDFTCPDQTYTPVEFPKPNSWLQLLSLPGLKDDELVIQLAFRTHDSAGVMVYSEGTTCLLMVTMTSSGVYFEHRISGAQPDGVRYVGSVADGKWHSLTARVTQRDLQLSVDASLIHSAPMPDVRPPYDCTRPTRLRLGGGADGKSVRGFAGCIQNIVINRGLVEITNKTQMLTSAEVHPGRCELIDKCFPSPCLNGGRCKQDWLKHSCDCAGTLFYGQNCASPIYQPTCDSYYKVAGLKEEAYCLLDSDGIGTLQPYTAECNFTASLNRPATIIHHNRETRTQTVDGDEHFQGYTFHKVVYELPMEQITALIESSGFCRQLIHFDCYNSILLNAPAGAPNAGWQTRSGEIKTHWGGVPSNGSGCKCGVDKTCLQPEKLCNCDSINNRWSSDEGYLTDKNALPVTLMQFTTMNKAQAFITLGPLECFGTEKTSKNQVQAIPEDTFARVCMTVKERNNVASNDSLFRVITPLLKPMTDRPDSASSGDMSGNMTTGQPHELMTYPWSEHQLHVKGSPNRSFTALEVILISVAALSLVLLTTKFAVVKIVGKVRRRRQMQRLHDSKRRHHGTDPRRQYKVDNGTELLNGKREHKTGLNAYWV